VRRSGAGVVAPREAVLVADMRDAVCLSARATRAAQGAVRGASGLGGGASAPIGETIDVRIVSKPAALRNKLVERVITGTQPVRRRSPRNLERKAYNFSRNAANSRPREVGVKETAASIREKRQMDSRMRIEAVAKNAELRAKRVNLMHALIVMWALKVLCN